MISYIGTADLDQYHIGTTRFMISVTVRFKKFSDICHCQISQEALLTGDEVQGV